MDLMDVDAVTADALYSPLAASDAFRLMVLQPGQRHDPIAVQLHAVSADSVPAYDALSYVWGDPRETVPIVCNGLWTNITVNLHAALVQVRSADVPRALWADALCINQKDKQERGQQVAIMGNIYSGARLVLACMGSSPDGRAAASIASLLADYVPVMASTAPPPTHDRRWASFRYLFRHAWFTRAWVLQEVGLARDPRVVYDDVDFGYRELTAAVKWLTTHAPGFADRVGIPGLLIHTLWTDWGGGSWARDAYLRQCALLDLLDHAALLACQDPRDHIYAFLGHPLAAVPSSTGRQLVPDYEKDVNQVYKEATVFLLGQSGVRTLSSAEHNEATLADFSTPSWVVRWDVGYTINNIYLHPSGPYRSCGGRTVPQMSLHEDILRVRGVSVDAVKDVYQMKQDKRNLTIVFTNQATGRIGTLDDLLSHLAAPGTAYAYSEPRALALALTLCVGRVAAEGLANFVEAWNAFRNGHRPGLASGTWRTPKNLALMERFWPLMMARSQGRALVLTEKGRYGLASHCSRPGDVCCVFDGGLVPFLLRPARACEKRTQTKAEARLVGEAYIHGLMQGEAVGMLERAEATEEVFHIT